MRLLHTADAHLGRTTHSTPGTISRAEDLGETLVRFAEVAVAERVDLAVLPGDVFHTRRPLPRDILYLGTAVSRLREAGILTLISGGNHDGPDTVGDERTHALAWMTALAPKGVRVFTNARATTLRLPDGRGLNVVATPYPHKRAFDALLPDAQPDERVEWLSQAYERAVETMIDSVTASQPDIPTLFMGHVSVIGAAMGSEISMRFGWDVTVRSGLFDKVDYAALGHIHRQQQMGDKAWYAGSPEYMDFGEEGQPKGYLLVEFDAGKAPQVEVIGSSPRPMLTVNARESETGWDSAIGSIPDGAIVRLVLHPQERVSPTDVLRMVREYRAAGASFVSYSVVLPERAVVRRASVAQDAEVDDALRAYLISTGNDIEPYLSAGVDLVNSMRAT